MKVVLFSSVLYTSTIFYFTIFDYSRNPLQDPTPKLDFTWIPPPNLSSSVLNIIQQQGAVMLISWPEQTKPEPHSPSSICCYNPGNCEFSKHLKKLCVVLLYWYISELKYINLHTHAIARTRAHAHRRTRVVSRNHFTADWFPLRTVFTKGHICHHATLA